MIGLRIIYIIATLRPTMTLGNGDKQDGGTDGSKSTPLPRPQ
jgi:hypothetical protein